MKLNRKLSEIGPQDLRFLTAALPRAVFSSSAHTLGGIPHVDAALGQLCSDELLLRIATGLASAAPLAAFHALLLPLLIVGRCRADKTCIWASRRSMQLLCAFQGSLNADQIVEIPVYTGRRGEVTTTHEGGGVSLARAASARLVSLVAGQRARLRRASRAAILGRGCIAFRQTRASPGRARGG